MSAVERPTRTLHRLTSVASFDPGHEWDPPVADPRVVADLTVNDLDRFPWQYKRYADPLPSVALPRALPATAAPAPAVMAGTADIPPGRLDVAQLARLLFLSAGVVRTTRRPYGMYLFRAAGSAGGRFPLEVYVAAPAGAVDGLDPGVYFYQPLDHALVRVGPPPRVGAGASIVVTGVPWRTGWRYRERGYRHVYWDAGTMLAQLPAAADSAGVPADLYTRFPDRATTALVGADGVNEWPVAVVSLGGGPPGLDPGGPAPPGLDPGGPASPGQVDASPREFPLVTAAQRAGDGERLGRPWDRGERLTGTGPGADGAPPVEAVIRARGSQRRMEPGRRLDGAVYRTCLTVGLRGTAIAHRVVVHGVDSVAPGLYRWPDPAGPLRAGDLRDEAYELCMQQDLARDASFVVVAAADLDAADDREYRDIHLAAGLAEGRLHLLAYALGASASGMTFVDAMVPAFLDEPLHGVLCTCIGVPSYRSTPGGTPGRPVEVGHTVPGTSSSPVRRGAPSPPAPTSLVGRPLS